jgi:hypothetical protein
MQQRAPIVAFSASAPEVASPRFNPQSFCAQEIYEHWSTREEPHNLVKCNNLMTSIERSEEQSIATRKLCAFVPRFHRGSAIASSCHEVKEQRSWLVSSSRLISLTSRQVIPVKEGHSHTMSPLPRAFYLIVHLQKVEIDCLQKVTWFFSGVLNLGSFSSDRFSH